MSLLINATNCKCNESLCALQHSLGQVLTSYDRSQTYQGFTEQTTWFLTKRVSRYGQALVETGQNRTYTTSINPRGFTVTGSSAPSLDYPLAVYPQSSYTNTQIVWDVVNMNTGSRGTQIEILSDELTDEMVYGLCKEVLDVAEARMKLEWNVGIVEAFWFDPDGTVSPKAMSGGIFGCLGIQDHPSFPMPGMDHDGYELSYYVERFSPRDQSAKMARAWGGFVDCQYRVDDFFQYDSSIYPDGDPSQYVETQGSYVVYRRHFPWEGNAGEHRYDEPAFADFETANRKGRKIRDISRIV